MKNLTWRFDNLSPSMALATKVDNLNATIGDLTAENEALAAKVENLAGVVEALTDKLVHSMYTSNFFTIRGRSRSSGKECNSVGHGRA